MKPIKKVAHRFSYWTPEERDTFIQACSVRDPEFTEAVIIACHTGMRLGELAGLKWSSVDFSRKMITVRESYNFRLKEQLPHTKNKDIVDIPMNSLVSEVMKSRKQRASHKFVFDLSLLASACHKLKHRCKVLGVKVIRFHDLRHTFASCLAMGGVDLMTIKELMRHKSYQMTLRYAHLHPDHLIGKTEILCGRGHGNVVNGHENLALLT